MQLGVTIAFASATILATTRATTPATTSTSLPLLSGIASALCNALPPQPTQDHVYYSELIALINATLPSKLYPNTIGFISSQGKSTVPYSSYNNCMLFFNTLGKNFKQDLTTNQQTSSQYYNNLIGLFNADV